MTKKIIVLILLLSINIVEAGRIYDLNELSTLDYQVARINVNDGISIPYKDKEAIIIFEERRNNGINLGFFLLGKKAISLTFQVGQSMTIDIDKDGTRDARITIDDITEDFIELRVEELLKQEDKTTIRNNKLQKEDIFLFIGIITMIIIIAIGFAVYISDLKNKR